MQDYFSNRVLASKFFCCYIPHQLKRPSFYIDDDQTIIKVPNNDAYKIHLTNKNNAPSFCILTKNNTSNITRETRELKNSFALSSAIIK